MQRGSLVIALLSLAGSALAFAIALAIRDPRSLLIVLGVVLLANSAVRFAIARRAAAATRPGARAASGVRAEFRHEARDDAT